MPREYQPGPVRRPCKHTHIIHQWWWCEGSGQLQELGFGLQGYGCMTWREAGPSQAHRTRQCGNGHVWQVPSHEEEGENFFFDTSLLFSFFLRASSSPTNPLCLFKCCSWDWQWVSVGVYSPWVLVNKATVNPKSTNVNPHAGGCAQGGGSYKPWLNWWNQSLNQWCAVKGKQWALRGGSPDVVASEDFHGVNIPITANFKLPFFFTALKIPDNLKISSFKLVWASNKTTTLKTQPLLGHTQQSSDNLSW